MGRLSLILAERFIEGNKRLDDGDPIGIGNGAETLDEH